MSATDFVVPVSVAVIAAVPGVLAYRAANHANRATADAKRIGIEAGAYARARELYESALDQLQHQLSSIQSQAAAEREVSNALRSQVNALEDTVARLRRQMILAGLGDQVGSREARSRQLPTHDSDPEPGPPVLDAT